VSTRRGEHCRSGVLIARRSARALTSSIEYMMLLVVGLAGIAIAALLGAFVARTALRRSFFPPCTEVARGETGRHSAWGERREELASLGPGRANTTIEP